MYPAGMDAAAVAKIVEAARARQEALLKEPITGPATALKCECGGVLHERTLGPPPLLKRAPRSRNRRIRKKQFKRWLETSRPVRMLHIVMGAARPMGYRCASCKRHVGFYQAIGRNLFTIEPMPEGALPIYDRDPTVTDHVLGVGEVRHDEVALVRSGDTQHEPEPHGE